jgi:AcrR family transcriptional regulator
VTAVDAPGLAAPDTRPTARDRLLDATERCLRRTGLRRVTMTDVAREAGLSRAWLYRQFPDKASLVLATLARIDEQFWSDAHARIAAATGISARVAEAVALSREQRPGALLLELQAAEPEAFAAVMGTGLRQMMPGMATFWHSYLDEAIRAGEIRPDVDVARAAEWVMRVVLSLVTVPGHAVDVDDPVAVRRFLSEFLVAGLR